MYHDMTFFSVMPKVRNSLRDTIPYIFNTFKMLNN